MTISPETEMVAIRLLRSISEKAVLLKQAGLAQEIDFFTSYNVPIRSYIAAFDGDKVVGLVSFMYGSSRGPEHLGIGFVSVSKGWRNKGVAKALVEKLFKVAENEGKSIFPSYYEDMGKKYLHHVMERTAIAFPAVALIDRGE